MILECPTTLSWHVTLGGGSEALLKLFDINLCGSGILDFPNMYVRSFK